MCAAGVKPTVGLCVLGLGHERGFVLAFVHHCFLCSIGSLVKSVKSKAMTFKKVKEERKAKRAKTDS